MFRAFFFTTVFVLATSLYEGVVSSLIYPLLPRGHRFAASGYRSNIGATTALGALLESECTWMQIAANALNLVSQDTSCQIDDVLRGAKELRTLSQDTLKELAQSYEDPDWYWRVEPRELLVLGKRDQRT